MDEIDKTVKIEPKKVGFAYSRLSQKDRHKLSKKEKETSLKNAKNDILDYCKQEGVELLYFGEEKYQSGARWDREEIKETLNKAKKYALERSFEIENNKLVVQFFFKNLSRYARDGVFQEINLREMEDPPYYIEIVSIEEGEIIKDRSMRMMLGAWNERVVTEGRKISEKRHNQKLDSGAPPIHAPFGYWNDKNVHNWAIDKKDSKIVKKFWELFAEGKSYQEICCELGISIGKYYRILDNFENYLGKIVYRKKIKDSKGKVYKVIRKVFDGTHEAILTDIKLIDKIKNRLSHP